MKLPKEVKKIIKTLADNGFEGYAVGGCVRDIIRGVKPSDFDIATNAKPEEVKKIFKKNFSDNNFGTVVVFTESKEDYLKEIEITTYRTERDYEDKRRPNEVNFVNNIEEDLKRRDFTINAMAVSLEEEGNRSLVDPFGGQEDLKNNIIRAVGNPEERFSEDALRMMRAVRFSSSLGFNIEEETKKAIKNNSHLLKEVSNERIRDEFVKIINSKGATEGVENLRKLNLLKKFLPEILEGYGVMQSKHHIYDCYHHYINSLKYATKKNFNFHVRMAALFHDIGKPRSKRGTGEDATFYNHEVIGAKMTRNILKRLKFKKTDVEKITLLVRYHLFYYNVGEVTESSVRRLLRKVGRDNIEELIQVRMSDRIGSGVPKAEPYNLRHMRYLIEKVSQDPISTEMLNIDGKKVMEIMDVSPGPVIGDVLNIILLEVINDPEKNKKEFLENKVREIKEWKEEDIRKLGKESKQEINNVEIKRDNITKKKHWVK